MQSPANERELITRAQQQDRHAIGSLYEHYAQAIFHYISYRVETKTLAEDLTAEVFLRMIRRLPTYTYTGAPFGAWLYRIASNLIADHYRSKKEVLAEIPEDYQSDAVDPFDELSMREDQLRLKQAILSLSEEYQNVIILRFIKELSHTEVADIMDRSEGAVRVLQHRAIKALETAMTKPQADDMDNKRGLSS